MWRRGEGGIRASGYCVRGRGAVELCGSVATILVLVPPLQVLMQVGSVPAAEIQQMLTQALQSLDALDVTPGQREHLKVGSPL